MARDQLDIIGKMKIKKNLEIYKVVDFLNKNLKNKNLVFGVSTKENDSMEITIYNS